MQEEFQSTHPSWGATEDKEAYAIGDILFQSTHPSWGATNRIKKNITHYKNFNPRTHRGVRQAPTEDNTQSIKNFNPRTHRGVRPDQMGNVFYFPKFQSTHPSWGAT